MQNEAEVTFFYTTAHEIGNIERNELYYNAIKKVEKDLSTLNLNRGGSQTHGFVFEDLHASHKNIENMRMANKEVLYVLDDNGIADFQMVNTEGEISYQQAKTGYSGPNKYKITQEKYGSQTLVVDKGNQELLERAKNVGIQSEESAISKEEAIQFTERMKTEGRLRENMGLSNTAPITSKLYALSEQLQAAHIAGLDAAKGAAALAAGMSFGKNFYQYIEGNVDLRELVFNTAKDTAVSAVGGYAAGATGYIISGVISETAVSTVLTNVVVSIGAESILVSVGSITAAISAAAGPLFLVGMAIGTGVAVCKSMKEKNRLYHRTIARANSALSEAMKSMKAAYDSLDRGLKEFCEFWDSSFERAFDETLKAIQCNDFEGFSKGLDIISNIFGAHVLFKTEKEFDDFFFDENAVLTL